MLAVFCTGCGGASDVERFGPLPDNAIAAFRDLCRVGADGPADPVTGSAKDLGVGRNRQDERAVVVERCVVSRETPVSGGNRSADQLVYEADTHRLINLYVHVPAGETFDRYASELLVPALSETQRRHYEEIRAEAAKGRLAVGDHAQWITSSVALSIELGIDDGPWVLSATDVGTHADPAHR